ncbi:uncharacterized protein NECHADRAFT_76060 [Fusarium vanettenii 77-13-4]|uniref:Heterokaryon incompatibility domain-containing protein n=1 Tax=Fusarium vanettenii (strain ATCC MYA-4622 / CBS 123669 / FGSC 9596 / NRRL 45880 / 77-13-4) TaxID=660122 RepID=C7Z6D1_FUSV7|nr:uncharacterized protein NECHADRAFT_76060 [Fusarium vanettenii 77-13-4]EEU40671.1 hypothetical protein NECHADRAFT_76060 [Fusarium vanettenii 77-13-4]
MAETPCKDCVEKRVLDSLRPPLDRTNLLATWSHQDLVRSAPVCAICNFILEIIGDSISEAGAVPRGFDSVNNIFIMSDGDPFASTYQLTLYWQTMALQRSVSIYPNSPCGTHNCISMLRPKPSPTLDAYGFFLVAAQASISEALSTSRWFSRGWTLPSSKLTTPCSTTAPRHLGDEEEEYFLEGEDPTGTRKRKRQMAEEIEETRKARNTLETFANYKQLLQTYTGRTLTYERDTVKAFEGVLEYFRVALGPHVWGLPSKRFDEALLWQVEKPSSRRAGYPSWSWCGWYLSSGSHLTHLDSSRQSAKYFKGAELERTSISELDLEPSTSQGAVRNGFPDIIVVQATYTTLGIRRDMLPYQGKDSFEVIEPTSQRKLANMTLGPEWAADLRQVTFWNYLVATAGP